MAKPGSNAMIYGALNVSMERRLQEEIDEMDALFHLQCMDLRDQEEKEHQRRVAILERVMRQKVLLEFKESFKIMIHETARDAFTYMGALEGRRQRTGYSWDPQFISSVAGHWGLTHGATISIFYSIMTKRNVYVHAHSSSVFGARVKLCMTLFQEQQDLKTDLPNEYRLITMAFTRCCMRVSLPERAQPLDLGCLPGIDDSIFDGFPGISVKDQVERPKTHIMMIRPDSNVKSYEALNDYMKQSLQQRRAYMNQRFKLESSCIRDEAKLQYELEVATKERVIRDNLSVEFEDSTRLFVHSIAAEAFTQMHGFRDPLVVPDPRYNWLPAFVDAAARQWGLSYGDTKHTCKDIIVSRNKVVHDPTVQAFAARIGLCMKIFEEQEYLKMDMPNESAFITLAFTRLGVAKVLEEGIAEE